MKTRYVLFWALVLIAGLLWFSVGVNHKEEIVTWVYGDPDITGVWEFNLTNNVSEIMTITESHIECLGQKVEYKAFWEGDIIFVKIPVPTQMEGAPMIIETEHILFLAKKEKDSLNIISVGLDSAASLTKLLELSEL